MTVATAVIAATLQMLKKSSSDTGELKYACHCSTRLSADELSIIF